MRGENTRAVRGFQFSVFSFGFALRSRRIAVSYFSIPAFPTFPLTSHVSPLTSHLSAFSPYSRLVFFNFRRYDITPCVLKKLPHPWRECARPPARLPIDL
jgi:hypothetical protein